MDKIQIQNIETIWDTLTPEELKNVDVFRVQMEVFCEAINEYSPQSINIQEIFKDEMFLRELYGTYGQIFVKTLTDLQLNTSFHEENEVFKFQSGGIDLFDIGMIEDPLSKITQEEMIQIREFFELKGIERGIHYQYDFISKYSSEKIEDLKIEVVQPLQIDIEGSISKVLFDYFVKILSIPLGFSYHYTQLKEVDLGGETDNEYYWNQNNEFIEQYSVDDYPDQGFFDQHFKRVFSKLDVVLDPTRTYQKTYNFLYEVDYDLTVTNKRVDVTNYSSVQLAPYLERTFELDNGRKLVYRETYRNKLKEVHYYDGNSDLIHTFGGTQDVKVDFEFEVTQGHIQVRDSFRSTIDFLLSSDNVQRKPTEQDLPPEFAQPNQFLLDDAIQFDGQKTYVIDAQVTSSKNLFRPLIFDWTNETVSKATPYNNTVNEWMPFKNIWDRTHPYNDLYDLARSPKNHHLQYQPSSPNHKFFFSGMDLEPWQAFKETEVKGKENYGYFYKDEFRWKFIGQDSGRPVNIGERDLFINRGIRKYPSIPGYVKMEPIGSNPYYNSSLDDNLNYWQPDMGIYVPTVGNVSSNVGDMDGQNYQLYVGQNFGGGSGDYPQQYETFKDQIENGLGEDDYSSGEVYWFELPRIRQQKYDENVSTFYRGISPLQEEMNYMHFKQTTSDYQDPVNLQYRTLEYFDIQVVLD